MKLNSSDVEIVKRMFPQLNTAVNYISFESCASQAPKMKTATEISVAKKENTEMCKEIRMLEEQRSYLYNRLYGITGSKVRELQKKFLIQDDPSPKNAKEARERLAAGLFTVDGEDSDRYYQIRWRDPKKPADETGFDAAKDALHKDKEILSDKIAILEPAAALTALHEFENTPL